MFRPISLAAALAMATAVPVVAQATAGSSRPLGAQGELAWAEGRGNREVLALVDRAVFAAVVKPAYRVHLVSDWPQYGIAGTPCVNGGTETLSGSLSRTSGGDYRGSLERRATIRFCGTHGSVQGEVCSLTLTSQGPVTARGEVAPLEAGRPEAALTLHWSMPRGATADDIVVEGDCDPAFVTSLRNLYLGVSHAVEFPVPLRGEAKRLTRLEQGWIVEAW